MKVVTTLVIAAMTLGAKVALAAPLVEHEERGFTEDVVAPLMGRGDVHARCLPDGWCGASQAGLPSNACCSGRVDYRQYCCVSARAIEARDDEEASGTPPPLLSPKLKREDDLPNSLPILPFPTHVTVHMPIPASLLATNAPLPTEKQHVSPGSDYTLPHHPFPSPTLVDVGPGWSHSLAHRPLPDATTLATVVKERSTPPLCVIGGNCSQGPPPEDEASNA